MHGISMHANEKVALYGFLFQPITNILIYMNPAECSNTDSTFTGDYVICTGWNGLKVGYKSSI